MSKDTRSCAPDHTLACAARSMWEGDCGAVPIVDEDGRVVGMITDRDICIAAYTQNKLLSEIPISSVAKRTVVCVRPKDTARTAEALMQRHQVRRLPVVDDGGRLVGMLSLNDLARGAGRFPDDIRSTEVARTLAAISQPHEQTIGTT